MVDDRFEWAVAQGVEVPGLPVYATYALALAAVEAAFRVRGSGIQTIWRRVYRNGQVSEWLKRRVWYADQMAAL